MLSSRANAQRAARLPRVVLVFNNVAVAEMADYRLARAFGDGLLSSSQARLRRGLSFLRDRRVHFSVEPGRSIHRSILAAPGAMRDVSPQGEVARIRIHVPNLGWPDDLVLGVARFDLVELGDVPRSNQFADARIAVAE